MVKRADVEKLTLEQLQELEGWIALVKDKAQEAAKAELLATMRAMAAEKGMTVEQVMGFEAPAGTRRPATIKYRHPNKPELTWAGRGMKPKWMTEYIAAGGKLEDCEV